ncbi:type VI secretion system Vgr family protein [Flexibacterium corallicola]|uniref:type VI secretion system Vgr family protein n=1 Tax=Flexibacterium corallicola TaxID=3037259 RepID=UPI00286F26E7|nr:type VI secretion system tip protein TssI/VgrG [Pseudovibrio sp. M1P-2-3]
MSKSATDSSEDIAFFLNMDGASYVVESLQVEERLSQVPTYELVIADISTPLADLIGKHTNLACSKAVYTNNVKPRSFAGIIVKAQRILGANGLASIQLLVRPSLCILELGKNSAIYQNLNTIEIWGKVLENNNVSTLKLSGVRSLPPRGTCIQYEEDDLAFCQRLLSEEGHVYFFSDGKDPEALTIHDPSKPFPSFGKAIELEDVLGIADRGTYHAKELDHTHRLTPATSQIATYDAQKVHTLKAGPASSSSLSIKEKPSVYRYIPLARDVLSSAEMGKVAGAEQAGEVTLKGVTEHPALHIGQTINLGSNTFNAPPKNLTLTAFTYSWSRGSTLHATFEATPQELKLFPKRLPKPQMTSVHNAVVIGSKEGSPACDEQGRVQVKFFWDITEDQQETSGFIRVAETFAGNAKGALFLPRVGQEVLISFLQGDPDLPIITGQIYNEQHKHPFSSANTTRSGFVTGLGEKNNELEFEDAEGNEKIGVRAAKDLEVLVEENALKDVKKLETTTIGETSNLTIGQDQVTVVKNKTDFSTGEREVKTEKKDSLAAQEIELSADTKITLKVGSSKLEITPSAITISAAQLNLEGKSQLNGKSSGPLSLEGLSTELKAQTTNNVTGLQVTMEGQAQVSIKAPLSEVNSQGPLMLKGLPTMIN